VQLPQDHRTEQGMAGQQAPQDHRTEQGMAGQQAPQAQDSALPRPSHRLTAWEGVVCLPPSPASSPEPGPEVTQK
jgi:hypothetical protein